MAGHVCPWWIGILLVNPFRRLVENPKKMLEPYVKEGMTVLEPGCGMGFFTLDMARLAGPSGRVVAIDLQSKMISVLRWRAKRAGLDGQIETRICGEDSLSAGDLAGSVDLACAIYVVHEVPDASSFFREIYSLLVPGGRFLVAEPNGHVSAGEFEESVATAQSAGFEILERPEIGRGRAVLLGRD